MKAIILAAGTGTRMKSKLPKCMHKILGRTMLDIVLDTLKESGTSDIIVVTGHGEEQIRASVSSDVRFAHQSEQLGTGHAVMTAAEYIGESDDVLVLCGDTPLITAESVLQLTNAHMREGNAITVVSTRLDNPYGYGRIVRPSLENRFLRIVEQKDLTDGQDFIGEINTGVYFFKGKALLAALPLIKSQNAANEYYLTDTLEIIQSLGLKAGVAPAPDSNEFIGVNNRIQLAQAGDVLKRRINEKLMLNGITIIDPETTRISPDVTIGMDTVIYPGVILEKSHIGENCTIGPNTRIVGSYISDCAEIDSSVVLDSSVGAHTQIGPFAYLRPNSNVGPYCKIGDFVEVKNSIVNDNTKAAHLAYIGDADVGSHVNFSCGAITSNYDGDKKYRTVIEDDVFIGCNTNLVAPVTVKKGAYTAAGSTITDDVPEKSLGIARARQVNKEGWIKKSPAQG